MNEDRHIETVNKVAEALRAPEVPSQAISVESSLVSLLEKQISDYDEAIGDLQDTMSNMQDSLDDYKRARERAVAALDVGREMTGNSYSSKVN